MRKADGSVPPGPGPAEVVEPLTAVIRLDPHEAPATAVVGFLEARRSPLGPQCRCPAGDDAPLVNGVHIDPLQVETTLGRLASMLHCPATHVVNHLSADPTVIARKDAMFRTVLNRADLNVADGMGVVWACRALGYDGVRERVYGPEFMERVCSWGCERSVRHHLYGAAPGVPDRLARALAERHPGIAVAGFESPPYRPLSEEEIDDLAARVTTSGTDILWVGVGTPKQQFLADRLRPLLDVRPS